MNESKYGGMTVNERVFAAGLLDQYDRAKKLRDRDAMLNILTRVEMSLDQAEETVDAFLANPEFYGY